MPNFVVFDAPKLEFKTVSHSFVQLQTASYSCAKPQIVICWFNSVLIWSSKWKGACEKNHNDKSLFQIFLIYNLMFSNYLFQTFTTFNVTLVCNDNGLMLAKTLILGERYLHCNIIAETPFITRKASVIPTAIISF